MVDLPFPGPSQPFVDSLHYGKTLALRGNFMVSSGPESHDMEVPTRGATSRCASVSECFLYRNCVLSVPSLPPLTVVFSKSIEILFVAKNTNSAFLELVICGSSCQCPSPNYISFMFFSCITSYCCNHLKHEARQSCA